MTYEEALALLRGPGSKDQRITRPGIPGDIVLRFGYPALVMRPRQFIAFTPTYEDIRATDWTVHSCITDA